MTTNFTLDEMILQYSECPFLDEKMMATPAIADPKQKRKVLSRLLLIASNIFNKSSQPELNSYKRRYEFE